MKETKGMKESKIRKTFMEFLVNFPFFQDLTSEELAVVAEHMNVVEADAEEVLFKEGEKGDSVYFVVSGELDVIKETVGGRKPGVDRVVITTLSKGRSIGEMSIIDNTPRSATVKARTSATLVTLTLEGFEYLCDQHPRIGNKLLKGIARLLSMNMRKTSSRLADYMLPVS